MAIKEKVLWVILHPTNTEYFESKKYILPKEKDKSNRMRTPRGTKIEVKLEDLQEGSHILVTKICDVCGEECRKQQKYKDIIKGRKNGNGLDRCEKCGDKKGTESLLKNIKYVKSVAYKAPHLISEWHPTLNNSQSYEIAYGSHIAAWWLCPNCNSPYDTPPRDRIHGGQNCPICSGRRLDPKNSLFTLYPDIAKEWNYEKNGILTPHDVTKKSSKRVWWICKFCNHEWKVSVCDRTSKNITGGCAKCNKARGENNHFWKGGITTISKYLREQILDWKTDSLENTNYSCVITEKNAQEIHHIYPFHKIILETLKEVGITLYKSIGDYSSEELKIISNKCIEIHYRYGLGIPLTKKIHKEFHSIYGRTDFTPENFIEFKNNKIKDRSG